VGGVIVIGVIGAPRQDSILVVKMKALACRLGILHDTAHSQTAVGSPKRWMGRVKPYVTEADDDTGAVKSAGQRPCSVMNLIDAGHRDCTVEIDNRGPRDADIAHSGIFVDFVKTAIRHKSEDKLVTPAQDPDSVGRHPVNGDVLAVKLNNRRIVSSGPVDSAARRYLTRRPHKASIIIYRARRKKIGRQQQQSRDQQLFHYNNVF